MQELVKYEAACRAVAEARTADEAKAIRDRSELMRAYARQAKNKQLEVDAAEIRMRAERRLGEILEAGKSKGQLHAGRPEKNGSDEEPLKNGSDEEPFKRVTLDDIGIDKKLSMRAQKLAAVPEEQFEGMLTDRRPMTTPTKSAATTAASRNSRRLSIFSNARKSGLECKNFH